MQERLRPIGEMGKREPSLKLPKPGVLQKPPLHNKQHQPDTFLNLSQIHPQRSSLHITGTPHGPGTPVTPALRSSNARTVRGARKSVRIIHDFDLLEAFWRREREYMQTGTLTCKYPWLDSSAHNSLSSSRGKPQTNEDMPTLQPMSKYEEWVAAQEATVEQMQRSHGAQDLSLSRVSTGSRSTCKSPNLR